MFSGVREGSEIQLILKKYDGYLLNTTPPTLQNGGFWSLTDETL